jgi:hypothetical protein
MKEEEEAQAYADEYNANWHFSERRPEPKPLRIIKAFGEIHGEALDEERFRALKFGDLIRVQLDGKEPEIRRFIGFGLRSPVMATQYLGFDYTYCFVDGSQKNNPKTEKHAFSVNRSRVLGLVA